MDSPEGEFETKKIASTEPLTDLNLVTREILWNSIPEARSRITALEEDEAEESEAVGRECYVSVATYLIYSLVSLQEAAKEGRIDTVNHFLDAYEKILELDHEYANTVMDDWVIKPVRQLGDQLKSRCGPLLKARAFPDD